MKLHEKIDYRKVIRRLREEARPIDEEMDLATAQSILEGAGVDFTTVGQELKSRLQKEVQEMISRGEEVPENLLKLLKTL